MEELEEELDDFDVSVGDFDTTDPDHENNIVVQVSMDNLTHARVCNHHG